MILDVIDTTPLFISMLLFPVVIIFIFVTIGRYIAYKKNKNINTKNQFIIFLIITIILTVIMVLGFCFHPSSGPHESQWQNISTH